jgi:hypothetical protein
MSLANAAGLADVLNMNVSATDMNTDTSADNESDAYIVATGYETVNLVSNATTASTTLTSANYVNTLDYDAANMSTLNISGNAQAVVTFTTATALTSVNATANDVNASNAAATALTMVNATANTAGVNVDASNAGATVTFNGSSAADTYVASIHDDLVQGNGGADAITLGAGQDVARYVNHTDSVLVLTDTDTIPDGVADVMSGYDVITGFSTTQGDLIELAMTLSTSTLDVLQKGAIGGTDAAAMQTFIGTGVDFFNAGVVDRAVAIANDGTNAYVFVDVNGDGNFTSANDMVIQVAGVTTLAITDFTIGNH